MVASLDTIASMGPVPLQEGVIAALGIFFLLPVLVALVAIVGMWKTFEKAGQPGWAAIIPLYNVYVLVAEVADRSMLWVVLSILFGFPIVVPMIDVAKAFGKGTGFGLGLFFLGFVFFPLLGFGGARYQSPGRGGGRGPSAATA